MTVVEFHNMLAEAKHRNQMVQSANGIPLTYIDPWKAHNLIHTIPVVPADESTKQLVILDLRPQKDFLNNHCAYAHSIQKKEDIDSVVAEKSLSSSVKKIIVVVFDTEGLVDRENEIMDYLSTQCAWIFKLQIVKKGFVNFEKEFAFDCVSHRAYSKDMKALTNFPIFIDQQMNLCTGSLLHASNSSIMKLFSMDVLLDFTPFGLNERDKGVASKQPIHFTNEHYFHFPTLSLPTVDETSQLLHSAVSLIFQIHQKNVNTRILVVDNGDGYALSTIALYKSFHQKLTPENSLAQTFLLLNKSAQLNKNLMQGYLSAASKKISL